MASTVQSIAIWYGKYGAIRYGRYSAIRYDTVRLVGTDIVYGTVKCDNDFYSSFGKYGAIRCIIIPYINVSYRII